MTSNRLIVDDTLLGIGLYSPAEAGRLLRIPPRRLSRWLRGHVSHGTHYERLWSAQADLGHEGLYLGFRDLQEARVAHAFIAMGMSAQRVRRAIEIGRDLVDDERPLSTRRFRTDGRRIFLQIMEEDGDAMIDVFDRQFVLKDVLEQSLKHVDFDDAGVPTRWWPLGKAASIVLDPARSFGQPLEADSGVAVEVLVAAAKAEGLPEAAARAWNVPVLAVRRALAFDRELSLRQAA